ncbi:other/HAL protein kinase [Amanita muscaria]
MLNSSEDTLQAEGESPDGSDNPPINSVPHILHLTSTSTSTLAPATLPSSATLTALNSVTVTPLKDMEDGHHAYPLPPPDSGTYEDKQPGHTRSSLSKLLATDATPKKGIKQTIIPPQGTKQRTMSSASRSSEYASGGLSSPVSSPTDSDWATSAPPSRAPSRPGSRAPSMSSGVSGNKILTPDPNAGKSGKDKEEIPPVKNGKTPSIHSFNLKDLLPSAPKLARKISQRSTSSRKSDSEAEGGSIWSKARSNAGDSTSSFSKKYGVCQKVAIGKGATSVVRLAHKWDRTEERLYAIKEFRKRRKNETEKEYIKKLTAEFCISSALHHPNIVETVDLVQDESQHWCEVMEYCPGGDLYAAIKKGGMSPSEAECCFKQILYGIQYLHSQGVAHRDIKPENLFFDGKGHLKIGDYGASTVYRLPWETTVHMSTGLCGSEPYIAPEQFLGKPYDARLVDVWACGIVYYCLHFQELPWRAAQPSTDPLYAAYAQACANPLPAVSICPQTINNLSPRACRSLIRRMLEPDPRQRTTIEEVMKHSWMQEIEVCYEVEQPRHIHVSARAMTKTNAENLGIGG